MPEATSFFNIIELLVKILGVIGGVFGGLPKLLSVITNPKIIIEDCSIRRARERTVLSWNLLNTSRLNFFGGDAKNVIVYWNIDSNDKEGWAYSGEAEPISLIPRGKDWHQKAVESFEVPDGNYTLSLHVTMRGETICVHTEKLSPPKKGFLTRLRS